MNNLISKQLIKANKSVIIALILLFGIGIRLFHYFYNRSLWLDELYLCSSFPQLSFTDIFTGTLEYGQKAPVGFLILVKSAVSLLGFNELALRLIPLLAGISALLLFAKLCKNLLNPTGQIIAIAICAFAPAIVYHSVEIKQYATEFLATIIALYLFTRYYDNLKWKYNILWGLSGALLIWFSFSVIFILLGIATGVGLYHMLKKNWKSLFFYAAPFMMWLGSFLLNYILFTRKQESDWVVYFFKVYGNFMPLPPHSFEDLKWFPRNFMGMMDYPLGLNWNFNHINTNTTAAVLTIIPLVFLFAGIYAIYKNNKQGFYVLIFPVLLTLLASGLYLYPLIERFWLFLAPIFILLIATGFQYGQLKIKRYQYMLMALIVFSPFCQALYFIVKPETFYKHKKSFQREALTYINNHFQNGDAVYNYWNNAPGYKVYRNNGHFKYKAITGRDFRKSSRNIEEYNQNLKLDFNRFSGKKRVWLIYNSQFLTDIGDLIDTPEWYYKTRISPTKNIYLQLSKIGVQVTSRRYKDVTVCLFELNTKN
ncbi:glycosyltransferase family 39 protein [Pedobacter heparinus]|uniref:glycosyltransferase family 39 protein n=1 Tax=Pedobacter heparinus TaxID=984 RepID=UPI00292D380E|nr:glycosyltransferase family 39 protein [Pedobacter heparinus]